MKKRPHIHLLLYFAAIIFVIMLITAFVMICLAFAMYHFGFLPDHKNNNPLIPIVLLLFISVIIGTVISFFVAGKILQPITGFGEVSAEVAKGNFSIRIADSSKIPEIQEFISNFNLMVRELGSIETLRDDFVSNISHEFKTPIAAIEGYVTLLQDSTLSDNERTEYTQMVIESARQLSTLSGNILSLSKLDNQEVLLQKKPFRLDEQIREAILLLENEWGEKNLDLQVDLTKLTYTGDANLLLLVWRNLIENAVKFTPDGGTISVLLYSENSDICVKIADTGCGMSPEVCQHVFDKFYQADTARMTSGNGLGLALVQRIVELHNGSVTVISEPLKGTAFTVQLMSVFC